MLVTNTVDCEFGQTVLICFLRSSPPSSPKKIVAAAGCCCCCCWFNTISLALPDNSGVASLLELELGSVEASTLVGTTLGLVILPCKFNNCSLAFWPNNRDGARFGAAGGTALLLDVAGCCVVTLANVVVAACSVFGGASEVGCSCRWTFVNGDKVFVLLPASN